ncbi:MFS transporter [Flavihumibacter sp. CACIAM 22H1]|uniref:MFS transporter n=1 Tax=Flavihumibacter sp. CACIAM 22H1 TaxID=1812911 RepID=UPI0007A8A509|nr:MFS transporter [Flavihumibacter sp. CACIAM 22H1]KYP16590.1 MAG: MFS transporter [Flavihumibacter sp. CACIAM 22H1]
MKENWKQFTLLVIVNAFVGGMIGLERSILPALAENIFHIAAKTAILSFILVFGLVKAFANYFTGALANQLGRRNLLIAGWAIGLPVPFLLIYAPNWNWIIAANILLGINQGLTWSSTVVMKIDLVGEKNRGLAMGLNEFSGYLAIALVAFLTGWLAGNYGIRPVPFYTGIFLVIAGLFTSIFLIRESSPHIQKEVATSRVPLRKNLFRETTWSDPNLGAVTQAGLINNLNDGMAWGLFPLLLASKGFDMGKIGLIMAIYPAVWGIAQLFTGYLADLYSKKNILYAGMLVQALALFLFPLADTLVAFIALSVLLGLGTAMVYPSFLATIADYTHPHDRAKSLGIFRFWRDLGYAIGALLTGVLADRFSIAISIYAVAGLTLFSALLILFRMTRQTGVST